MRLRLLDFCRITPCFPAGEKVSALHSRAGFAAPGLRRQQAFTRFRDRRSIVNPEDPPVRFDVGLLQWAPSSPVAALLFEKEVR
jgi:hypothetical protein